MKSNVVKNIRLFKIYSIFDELLILGPIIVLYMLFKGLSFTQIMFLQSFSAIAVFVLEVPTGAIADRFGRKRSIMLSKVAWIISLGIYILGNHFMWFMLAEFLFSVGISLKSGADSALLYDSMKSAGMEDEFHSVYGKAQGNLFYSQAVGSVIAGFVYSINKYLPMIISIGFILVALIISYFFIEEKDNTNTSLRKSTGYFTHILNSLHFAMSTRKIASLIVFTAVFFIFYRVGFWFFQPYLETTGIDVKYFGVVFFVFNMVAGLFSKYVGTFIRLTKGYTMLAMCALLSISFLLMALFQPVYGFLLILPQQMARGFYRPVVNKYANKHISSENRATVLSVISMATSLSSAIFMPLFGILSDSRGIIVSHYVLAVFSMLMIVFLKFYLDKRLNA